MIEVADDRDNDWLGRRVAAETYFSVCERCEQCRAGRRNLCPTRRSIGSFEDGGFAESIVVPVSNLHALPIRLGDALDGVLAEPLACVTHSLLATGVIRPGERVLVTGPGAMGQLAAQVAMVSGAEVLLAGLDTDAPRLAVAASLGIGTTTTAAVEAESFDVVVECSGSAAAANAALQAVRRAGRYLQVGIFASPVTIDFNTVLYKELQVSSGFASTPTSWRRAMELIGQGRLSLAPLITSRFALADFPLAFDLVLRGEGIKTVLVP